MPVLGEMRGAGWAVSTGHGEGHSAHCAEHAAGRWAAPIDEARTGFYNF